MNNAKMINNPMMNQISGMTGQMDQNMMNNQKIWQNNQNMMIQNNLNMMRKIFQI